MTQNKESYKKSTIEMLVLYLLSKEDFYGYQITQSLYEKSGGKYSILAGSLYPILYEMADNGYISDYDKQVGVRRVRKYYHLEEKGREHYEKLLNDYLSMIDVIDNILDRK